MIPESPNICLISYIFVDGLQQDVNTYAGGDPTMFLRLRRAYVAHETGHAVNLYHLRGCSTCLMNPVLSSQNPIPTDFQTNVSGDLECNTCPPPPGVAVVLIPLTGYNETDTLRIKP